MGFPIDNLDDDGRSLLHIAVLHNRESIIDRLLVLKADHSAEDHVSFAIKTHLFHELTS